LIGILFILDDTAKLWEINLGTSTTLPVTGHGIMTNDETKKQKKTQDQTIAHLEVRKYR